MEITIENCKKFVSFFLDHIKIKRVYRDDELENEANNVKLWLEDLDGKTPEDKLSALFKSIKAISEDIEKKKYKGKVFEGSEIPNRIKYYSWPNMYRINNIVTRGGGGNEKRDSLLSRRGDKEFNINEEARKNKEYKARNIFEKYLHEIIKKEDNELYNTIMDRGIENIDMDYINSFMKVQKNIAAIKKGIDIEDSSYK